MKRAASADDASWDDPVPPAIQVCCEELEKRLAEVDPAKGTWSISAGDSNTWTVWCDASGLALGAALEVDGKVVEDTTQLRPHQDKRHINIAELEAAILGLNLAAKWNVKRITLKIDSKTVFGWLKQVINDVRRVKTTGLHDLLVQRRLHIVSDMIDTIGAAVDVVWVSSDSNIADALTRVPSVWLTRSVGSIPDVTAGAVCETTVVGPISFDAVAAAQLEDEVVQRVASQVATRSAVRDAGYRSVASQLVVEDGVLLRSVKLPVEGEILVPVIAKSAEESVISAAHTNSGHASWQNMYEMLRERCYLPRMAEKCQQHVRSCQRCKAANAAGGQAAPATRPDMPGRPWGCVQIDTLELGASKSGEIHCVLVCVDALTKYAEVVPLRRHDGASVADAIVELCCRWGTPDVIRMDNGREFRNYIVKALLRVFGVEVKTGAVRHPQTQGMAERFNRTLLGLIRKVLEESTDWLAELPVLMHYYNSRIHSAIGISPMKAMIGWQPRALVSARINLSDPREWQDEHAARCARVRDLLDAEMSEKDHCESEHECPFAPDDSVLLQQPKRRQKCTPPYQCGWRIKKVLSGSTVVIWRRFKGVLQEKVINIDLLKRDVPAAPSSDPADERRHDREEESAGEESDDSGPYVVFSPSSDTPDERVLRDRSAIRPPARFRTQ